MHLGEALLPREEAIRMAAELLRQMVLRNSAYYDRAPDSRPDPDQPLREAIRADDTCIFIPFRRASGSGQPIVVRVNGVTKVVAIDRSF